MLEDSLSTHNPIIMYGKHNRRYRDDAMEKYQRFDTDYRLFITNTLVGGMGIDLDDQHGSFPLRFYARVFLPVPR